MSSSRRHAAALAAAIILLSACGSKDHARLLDGMGSIHHPIATSSPQAQRFFDQGLALVYAFNFGEAVNSFRRASELDPNAPMPYWGLALAYSPNYNAWMVSPNHERAGFDAIQTAVGLAPNAPEEERAYVDAMARAFTDEPKPDQPKLASAYSDAMRELYRRNPDDPDAAVLFAASLMNLNPWHLWTVEGEPGPDTNEIVTVLEDALRRWPEHTGANHFYVHTMEASKYPERALPSARRLETLAPNASHLVHMPSHIYLRSGYYAAAVRSNQQAIEADRNYRSQQPDLPAGSMGYSNHNEYFLAVAAGMDGEFEVARSAAAAIGSHTHNEAMAAMPTLVLLRFGRWDDILAGAAPDTNLRGVTFIWHFARACAFAAKGRLNDASVERSAMEQAYTQLPPGRAFGMFFNDWSTLHSLATDSVSARISAANGDAAASIEFWRHAAATQDAMNFDDVPDWYCPVRESLGAALLRNKQLPEAEQVFRDDLKHNPRNPRSLYGLWKVLDAEGKAREGAFVQQSFTPTWKGQQLPRIEDF